VRGVQGIGSGSAFADELPDGVLQVDVVAIWNRLVHGTGSLPAAETESKGAVTALELATVPFDFRPAERERSYLKTFWATLG
jgi:hypothetical protein